MDVSEIILRASDIHAHRQPDKSRRRRVFLEDDAGSDGEACVRHVAREG